MNWQKKLFYNANCSSSYPCYDGGSPFVSKGKTQKTITDDPNNTSKVHVDSHSHADLNKGIQELKDMLISMKSALATFMEREK